MKTCYYVVVFTELRLNYKLIQVFDWYFLQENIVFGKAMHRRDISFVLLEGGNNDALFTKFIN